MMIQNQRQKHLFPNSTTNQWTFFLKLSFLKQQKKTWTSKKVDLLIRAYRQKLKNQSPLAQDYFRQADAENWANDKNKFLQSGTVEKWLTDMESDVDNAIVEHLIELIDLHISGLLADPDKVKGKKAKLVYNERQRKIAARIKALQENCWS